MTYKGTIEIPSGIEEYTVTGLDLSFIPIGINATLVKPGSNSENISINVQMPLTADGFAVEFSSMVSSPGYVLNFSLWDNEAEVGGIDLEDGLQVGYDRLFDEVKRYLGYTNDLSEAQTKRIDGIIQSGIRQFYFPPVADGDTQPHTWKFLKQRGIITLTNGQSTYQMPLDFGRIDGSFIVADTKVLINHVHGVQFDAAAQRHMVAMPRIAKLSYSNKVGAHAQLQEVQFYPIPDVEYVVEYDYYAYTGRLSKTNQIPCGGAKYSELIIESCLAVAERRENDERGIHYEQFMLLLKTAVLEDRKDGVQNFGSMLGRPFWPTHSHGRHRAVSSVYYNGERIL